MNNFTICSSYMNDLFNTFEKLHGIHRTQCLEMFLNRLSMINNPFEKITKLRGFFNILKDKYVFIIIVLQMNINSVCI